MFVKYWKSPVWEKEDETGTGEAVTEETVAPAVLEGSENAAEPKEMLQDQEDDLGFDIEELLEETEDEPEDVIPDDEPPAPEPVKAKEPEKPKTETTDQPKPEGQKAEEEVAQQPEVQPAAQPEAEIPQLSSEELSAQYEKFFSDGVEALAQNVYTFDEETRDLLDTEPSKVLPKLAGQLHMQVLTAATTMMANMLPQMLQMHQAQVEQQSQAMTNFHTKYPMLKGHESTVLEIGKVYRAMNPQVTGDKAVQDIAEMAIYKLKLFEQAGAPSTTQEEPGSNVPHIPISAKGSTPGAIPPTAGQKTTWEELVEED